MADLVGEAYVKVHADTKFMARAIERDMRKIGKKAADSLLDDFDSTLRASTDRKLKTWQGMLADAIVGGDFDTLLRKHGGSVEKFTADITRDLEKIRDKSLRVAKATGKASKEFKDFDTAIATLGDWAAGAKMREDARNLAREIAAAHDEANRLNRVMDARNKAHLQALAEAAKRLQAELASTHDEANKVNEAFDALGKRYRALNSQERLRLSVDFEQDADRAADVINSRLEPAISRLSRQLDAHGDRWVVYGNRVGRVFGKGSRNDFLNFTGSVIGGFVSMGRAIPEVISRIIKPLGDVIENFRALRLAGATVGSALGRSLLPAVDSVAAGVAAMGAAFVGVALLLPPLVAGFSLLAGSVVAVAGAITVALAGALLPIVPIVAAIAAGVGSIIPVFTRMNDKGDQLYAVGERIRKSWGAAMDEISGGLEEIARAMESTVSVLLSDFFVPLMRGMQEATAEVVTNLGQVLDNPVTKKFFEAWSTTLPLIFGNMGRAMNQALAGVIAFFAPVLDYAELLSANFETMMTRFNTWASSAEGQNSIRDFMEDAWEAATDLWNTLENLVGIIGKVFKAGSDEAGGDFLDWLSRVTEKYNEWLGTEEGQEAMRSFFRDVRDTMVEVKDILAEVGKAFDELDNPETRQGFNDFLDVIHELSIILPMVSGAMRDFSAGFNDPGVGIEAFNQLLSDAGTELQNFYTRVQTFFDEFWGMVGGAMVSGLESLGGFIVAGLSQVWEYFTAPFRAVWNTLFGNSIIPDIVNGFARLVPQIPTIITSALSTVVSVFTAPFRSAYAVISGLLPSFGTVTSSVLSRVPGMGRAALGLLPSFLSSPFSSALGVVSGLANRFGPTVSGILSRVPGAARSAVSALPSTLSGVFSSALGAVSGVISRFPGVVGRLSSIPGAAGRMVSGVVNAIVGPFRAAYSQVSGWIGNIRGLFDGIISSARTAASKVAGVLSLNPSRKAAGAILHTATPIIAGEAGREAVIPLDRPLSMIDPSVRDMAATLRGAKTMTTKGGKTVIVERGAFNIMVPNSDPAAVAEAVLNRMVELA